MDAAPHWLPAPILLDHYRTWESYLEALYGVFQADFVMDAPYLHGQRVNINRRPIFDGKETTFWHIISEGGYDLDRVPAPRRCERVGWVRPVIENVNDAAIREWERVKNGERRAYLWLLPTDYLIVLTKPPRYCQLITAYPIPQEHTKRRLLKEYEEYNKNR